MLTVDELRQFLMVTQKAKRRWLSLQYKDCCFLLVPSHRLSSVHLLFVPYQDKVIAQNLRAYWTPGKDSKTIFSALRNIENGRLSLLSRFTAL